MRWKKSRNFTTRISESNAKNRNSKEPWNWQRRRLRNRRSARASRARGSIAFVFFDRFGFSDSSIACLGAAFLVSVFLVNILQDHCDHWGGGAAAVRFAADLSFVKG